MSSNPNFIIIQQEDARKAFKMLNKELASAKPDVKIINAAITVVYAYLFGNLAADGSSTFTQKTKNPKHWN